MNSQPFFILTCARSGSTSLSHILDLAINGCCMCEPSPNLNQETRFAMDGKYSYFEKELIVKEIILPRAQKQNNGIYGEKNLTYGPFIEAMHNVLICNFVFLIRDGRDVVTSLMNWHNQVFGSVYRECKFVGDLENRALSAAGNLPVHLDMSDFSRPRPLPGDFFFDKWENLNREEMCAYYWSHINELYLKNLKNIDLKFWKQINYSDISAEIIIELAEFLKLKGIEEKQVEKMLNSKINSVQYRCGENNKYPYWVNWDSGQRRRFNRIAKESMFNLGFYSDKRIMWKPNKYIENINQDTKNFDTNTFENWFRCQKNINSIASIGVDLRDKNYNIKNIYFKSFEAFIENHSNEKYDVVYVHKIMQYSYDIDQSIETIVAKANRKIVIICSGDLLTEFKEHKYFYNSQNSSFCNNISLSRIRTALEECRCCDIIIRPLKVKNWNPLYDIFITANVNR